MRFASPVIALIAALVIAACGSTAAPRRDTAGDAAFVAALKLLCSKTPAVAPIDPSAGSAAITAAANADSATVVNFVYGVPRHGPHGSVVRRGGLATLTPTIFSTSPLAATVTNAAEMALDMSKWYGQMIKPANIGNAAKVRQMAAVVLARQNRAQRDLARLGVASCLT